MNVVVLAQDPVLSVFLRRPLEPLGHRVTTVSALATVIEQHGELAADAIVLPRRLPDASVSLANAIVALREVSSARIVVLDVEDPHAPTARPEQRPTEHAGADIVLWAPFSDSDVLDAIRGADGQQKCILLADDSPLIHEHVRPLLEDHDFAVISAYDGQQALTCAAQKPPDLVITDIEMPVLDGYDVCRRLKNDPATAHIPVLIASTLGETHDLERGFDAGADDYLTKPLLPEELLTRVRELLHSTMPASRELILAVDDSPAQLHYVSDCLRRQGFRVETAGNGKEAFAKAQSQKPALIVSDYEMPEMSGFELVHAIRRDPELRNTPVIMLTARDSRRDIMQLRAAGATAYLIKPFAQDKCIAMVERTLAERRLLNYKQASSLYISDAARRAAEERALGDISSQRADELDMAVLFSDIVGFTRMSSQMAPAEVIALLNDYFDVLCPIIFEHGGDIDKFIGDAILAVFDQHRDKAPAAQRAVDAALAMQEAMQAFNLEHAVELQTRIGINTGRLVRGDLGSRYFRRDYTVIGDTVNRANRFEMNCPPGKVLVSEDTRQRLGDTMVVEEIGGLKLKGIDKPVAAYIVLGRTQKDKASG